MKTRMSKFSVVGASMLAVGALVAFGLRDAGNSIFPSWLVPVGAVAIIVGASITVHRRAHREMVVIAALAVLVAAVVDQRFIKSGVLAVAGVVLMWLDGRQRRQPPKAPPPLPVWALWALSIGALVLVLLLP